MGASPSACLYLLYCVMCYTSDFLQIAVKISISCRCVSKIKARVRITCINEMFIFLSLSYSYKWEAIDQDNKVKYTLKLCPSSPSTICGANVAVCAQNFTGSTSQSVGECRWLVSSSTRS